MTRVVVVIVVVVLVVVVLVIVVAGIAEKTRTRIVCQISGAVNSIN